MMQLEQAIEALRNATEEEIAEALDPNAWHYYGCCPTAEEAETRAELLQRASTIWEVL